MPIPIGGEPLPGEGDPLSRRLVEAVHDHHQDRGHRVQDDQPEVPREDEGRPPPAARAVGKSDGRRLGYRSGGDGAHTYSSMLRVPNVLAYKYMPMTSMAMSMTESADAIG